MKFNLNKKIQTFFFQDSITGFFFHFFPINMCVPWCCTDLLTAQTEIFWQYPHSGGEATHEKQFGDQRHDSIVNCYFHVFHLMYIDFFLKNKNILFLYSWLFIFHVKLCLLGITASPSVCFMSRTKSEYMRWQLQQGARLRFFWCTNFKSKPIFIKVIIIMIIILVLQQSDFFLVYKFTKIAKNVTFPLK